MRAISGGEIASLGLFFVVSEMCFIGCCLHYFEHIGSTDEPRCQTIVAGCVGLI